jgi:S-DNA-T family DNA segregation ATPase FtsK/SpoIIIE
MLFAPVGATKPMRAQGAFVSDSEVERVVTFIKEHNEKAHYDEEFTNQIEIEAAKCAAGKKKGGEQLSLDDFDGLGGNDGEDSKFWEAVEVAINEGKVSTSMFQRRLKLGYGRAAKIIDQMEEMGIVGPADGNKPRKLLITKQDYMEMRMNGRTSASPADGLGDGDFDEL